MTRAAIVCGLLWLLATPGAMADGEPPAQSDSLAAEVSKIIPTLDARELAARNEAEQRLLDLGPGVLPHLPVVDDDTPAEIALRVMRVQQKLLAVQAKAAARPTTVTLQGDNLPIAEVLASFEKQTGNPIIDYRADLGQDVTSVNVSVDFYQVPFWKAFDEVLDKAGMTLYSFAVKPGAHVINRVSDAERRSQRAHYAGIFRLEPLRFEAMRGLRADERESLRLYVEVAWEPRLQPFAILQDLGTVRATGDDGAALPAGSTDAVPDATIRSGTSTAELEISLGLPARSVGSVAALRGTLRAQMPGPTESFRFVRPQVADRNTPARRVDQRKAGTTVTLDRIRTNNQAWEVALRVKFDASSTASEAHRSWILDNEIYFEAPSGRRVLPGGFEQTRQTNDEVGVNYYFDLDERPDTLELVYRTPITILEMTVDYELHDLPLP